VKTGDHLYVDSLVVDCIVGMFESERSEPQPLVVDVRVEVDTRSAGANGRIGATVDYDRLAAEIQALLSFRRYRLLEMAAHETCAMIFGLHAAVESIDLRLRKPHALRGRAGSAGVGVRRRPSDYPRRHETAEFGEVEILLETKEAGLYLLHVEPSNEIPPHFHRIMRELEWLAAGQLVRDGRRLSGFEPVVWDKERVHTYRNDGEARATLFCCDCPPFVRSDEIVVRKPGSPRTGGSDR
jgi:dihydroneopterin aldolase